METGSSSSHGARPIITQRPDACSVRTTWIRRGSTEIRKPRLPLSSATDRSARCVARRPAGDQSSAGHSTMSYANRPRPNNGAVVDGERMCLMPPPSVSRAAEYSPGRCYGPQQPSFRVFGPGGMPRPSEYARCTRSGWLRVQMHP